VAGDEESCGRDSPTILAAMLIQRIARSYRCYLIDHVLSCGDMCRNSRVTALVFFRSKILAKLGHATDRGVTTFDMKCLSD